MTLRCAGAQWRLLVHERFPRRRSDGTLYGREYHVTSDPLMPEKLAETRRKLQGANPAADLGDVPSCTVLAGTEFDELVVGSFLHVEQMDEGHWWMDVGGLSVDVFASRSGKPWKVMVHGPDGDTAGVRYVLDWEGDE